MAEENQNVEQEEVKEKRTRVKFSKNVKFGENRYKKGDSLLLEKEKVEELKKAGAIE